MLRLGREREKLTIVFDQIGTPTYARHIAESILSIITKAENGEIEKYRLSGIYNFSNEGVTSWYDFALAIFEEAEIACTVLPIESKDYPTPAKRPFYSVLNKEKIKNTFEITIPHWRVALRECLKALEAEI